MGTHRGSNGDSMVQPLIRRWYIFMSPLFLRDGGDEQPRCVLGS